MHEMQVYVAVWKGLLYDRDTGTGSRQHYTQGYQL